MFLGAAWHPDSGRHGPDHPLLPCHTPPSLLLSVSQALFGTLTLDVMVLTILYSIAGLGIAIVNDFKSIEGGWGGVGG